jgi:phosphotransferase system  glucose/maltose/N-acetylglucosamine-specific IIC component
MKIETRNQLLGIIVGTAMALGIPLLPGIPDKARMWVMLVCIIVIFRVFRLPIVAKLFANKIKEDDPGGGSSRPGRH